MQLFGRLRKPNPLKIREDADILGYALHANGRVDAIKQGSGMYGTGFGAAGFGDGAFSETAFGTQVALSQSGFGWAAAYSVSTWVYRCIEVRKSAVHRMPWKIVDKRTKKILPRHPLGIALKRSKQHLFKKIEQSQLLYGETFLEFVSNPYGYTSDLFWLNNLGMAVLVGQGRVAGYSYTAMQGGHAANFDPEQVAFMKTDNPFNDLRGMSPTEVIMDEIAIDKDVARIVRAYYANDTRVGLLLIPKNNLTPADSQRFLTEWNKNNQGPNRAGKPQLMPYDISVERVQEPASLDDVQLRESTRREIAAAYGVPLSLAGAWDEARYQSLPEQRKSFYEETVIPECDNIADFMNADVMPVMDDSGRALFAYDYMSILALTEDAQKKNDIYSNRLVSGLITRAEAREALGHPVRDADHVYYIPTGATVVPEDELALVTPTANTVDTTSIEQNADMPAPAPPKPLPPGNPKPPQPLTNSQGQLTPGNGSAPKPTSPSPQALPQGGGKPVVEKPKVAVPTKMSIAHEDQATALDELNAWERKALNTNAVKAATFVCNILDGDTQDTLRIALRELGKAAPKAAIRGLFEATRAALKDAQGALPASALNYWARHDALEAEIGRGWLDTYMIPALSSLLVHTDVGNMGAAEIQAALDGVHGAFSEMMLGDDAAPGPLVKLVMAGMAAGQEAIYHGSAANPNRPVSAKVAELMIDWDLLSHEAVDFARQYLFNLIRNIDATTTTAVQEAVSKWIEAGLPLDDLKASLTDIFNNPVRAALIAQTESTRAFAAGSLERYRRADVAMVKLSTINDDHVCDICAPLEGTVVPLDQGWDSDTGETVPPFHPGCRHWIIPVVEGM